MDNSDLARSSTAGPNRARPRPWPRTLESSSVASSILTGDQDLEILECDRSGNVQQRWLRYSDQPMALVPEKGNHGNASWKSPRGWRKAIFDAFLPVGFPHSVSEDYLAYQTYDSLQAFFSTITSLLASRALLEGLGVGDANSTATYAMLLTILRDAMSRVATIVFAQQFGLQIEPDAKRYRFLADLFNDTAFFLELYSPYLGSWSKVLVLCTAQALRALCGVAAGSSKAALSKHFAKHDNLAELNAKEASQETAVGLIGLLVGTVVVKLVEAHGIVLALVCVLVLSHLWVNYLGVRAVQMTTLNRQRATILFQEYLKSGVVLSPKEVAARESILFWSPNIRSRHGGVSAHIEFPTSCVDAVRRMKRQQEPIIIDGHKFSIFVDSGALGELCNLRILLWDGADARDVIMAWFMALDMSFWSDATQGIVDEAKSLLDNNDAACGDPKLWEDMARQGWDLDSQAFETGAPLRVRFCPTTLKDQ